MDPSGNASVEAVCAAYLADCARRDLRRPTIRYYGMVLARFGSVAGISTLDELTVARVGDFQDSSAHLAPGSIRGLVRALKTFARWAHEEDILAADPLARLRLPRTDRVQHRERDASFGSWLGSPAMVASSSTADARPATAGARRSAPSSAS